MEGTFIEQVLQIERIEDVLTLFGNADQNVKIIEEHFGVNIVCRGTEVKITGEPEAVSKAQRTVDTLLAMIAKDGNLSEQNVRYVITLVEQGSEQSMAQMNNSCIAITVKGKPVKPKTLGQKKYIDAIQNNTITFGIGPAGTGKTYLAVAMAVTCFPRRAGQPHHPDPAGGGGGRKAGLSARRSAGQGRPLPAPALRRDV